MPIEIVALPYTPDTGNPAPSRGEQAWAWADKILGSDWLLYGLVALLGLALAVSIATRRKRDKASTDSERANLTRTDRAVTRITGILATAMVATGAWKVFGDVLELHPLVRLTLFFFAEAQIIAAWRRVRRHIYRHARLGGGIWTIYGIAFGSAGIATLDADTLVEGAIRLFAAAIAAYMIAEELAEELDIYLTAHPDRRPAGRTAGRINWAHNLESVLVWLRLAQATDRSLEEVERHRRIAAFARTAYKLHTLIEDEAADWRIRRVRRRLRRLTESANEHLKLATDQELIGEVRAQLALMYGVEAGTSRSAVADIQPLRPKERLAISATPHPAPTTTPLPANVGVPAGDSQPATKVANRPAPDLANQNASKVATGPADEHAKANATGDAKENASGDAIPAPRKPAKRAATQPAIAGAHPTAVKLAKYLAKYPGETNAELAKRMRVGDRTVSRYRADAEAINRGSGGDPDDGKERHSVAPPSFPIPEPLVPVKAGVNGHSPTFTEETP